LSGVECLITASESTVKGGADQRDGRRGSPGRLSDIAEHNRLALDLDDRIRPGADLPVQSQDLRPGAGAGFAI